MAEIKEPDIVVGRGSFFVELSAADYAGRDAYGRNFTLRKQASLEQAAEGRLSLDIHPRLTILATIFREGDVNKAVDETSGRVEAVDTIHSPIRAADVIIGAYERRDQAPRYVGD